MKVLITGSSGLIGSAAVRHFNNLDYSIFGVDSNARKDFFGPEGSTEWNLAKLQRDCKNFVHCRLDIRNRDGIEYIFSRQDFDVIMHFAAQPAHDYSYTYPYEDFMVNTVGTINLLDAMRRYSPNALFIFTSTSKVYGTVVNDDFELIELPTRYSFKNLLGVDENCRIDQTLHSMFGANKAAADLIVQEYGKYFGLKTVVLRPGCLTGSGHSAVELHGFLSYLIKCVMERRNYNIFGYKMKQVRDNIHANDIAQICELLIKSPPLPGNVYNVGGCKQNSISILEALDKVKVMTGKEPIFTYNDRARKGDHIVYISDMTKFENDYPEFKMKYDLDMIFEDIIRGYRNGH